MKIQVDSTKCQGYGLCEQIASALFVLDEFGYAATPGDGTVPPEQIEAAERAIAECPATAVRRVA